MQHCIISVIQSIKKKQHWRNQLGHFAENECDISFRKLLVDSECFFMLPDSILTGYSHAK